MGSYPGKEALSIDIFALWWVFPAAVLFSSLAVSSGISGALMFSPFFLLVVGLEPAAAIGAGLGTEVFGMGSGLFRYVHQRVVDYATAKFLLAASVPGIVVGSLLAHQVPGTALKAIFGFSLLVLALVLGFSQRPEDAKEGGKTTATGTRWTVIRDVKGQEYRYAVCNRGIGVSLAALGSVLTGLISAGLPEITTTQLVVRCRIPPRVAVATSVFVLGITVLVGAAVHAAQATPAFQVLAFSIPGVLVGSQIGSTVSRLLPGAFMVKFLSAVFGGVGLLMLALTFTS